MGEVRHPRTSLLVLLWDQEGQIILVSFTIRSINHCIISLNKLGITNNADGNVHIDRVRNDDIGGKMVKGDGAR